MVRIGRACRGFRPRDAVALLILISHLLVTFGFPVPALHARKAKDTGQTFPCQDHPCGCITAEECWKGDCSCSTLEQKLAWAEANGIEPPSHVRPLVASRRARASSMPGSTGCCSEAEPNCCKTKSTKKKPDVRWVVGLFAQKCRGEGPKGFFQLEPVVFANLTGNWLFECSPAKESLVDRPHWLTSTTHRPPTPPPRHV